MRISDLSSDGCSSDHELAASDAGLRYAFRHEEGDPRRLLAEAARSFDLIAIPTSGWPDGTAPGLRAGGVDALLSSGVRPILTGPAPQRTVRHVLFALGPGRQAADTVRWYAQRSEEHTSELQSLMRISYAVFCLKKKT